jgi:hypothetical protein
VIPAAFIALATWPASVGTVIGVILVTTAIALDLRRARNLIGVGCLDRAALEPPPTPSAAPD